MELIGYTGESQLFLDQWNDVSTDNIVAHTSGSTGAPKEIRLMKADMRRSAQATNRFFEIDEDSLLHLPLSPDYIAGKMMIVRAHEAGCRLIVEKPGNAPLREYKGRDITLSAVVPSQVGGLLDGDGCRHISNLIIGGAPLSTEAEEALIRSGIRAYATYGMTETCSHVALRRLGEKEFAGLPGFRFSTDERGCLVIDCDGFSFGRIVTNDVVELNGDAAFRWLGRADNAINSGGIKVIPEVIEARIAPLMGNVAFYITSRASEKWGEEIVMMVEGDDAVVSRETLRALLGAKICPKEIICVPRFERTSSSKVIRKKL